MSDTETSAETVCEETKHGKFRTGWRLRIVFGLLVLLVVAGFLFYMLRPTMYAATAYFQIFQQRPSFVVFDEKQQQNFDAFVNTQLAIIQSPMILEKALEDPNVVNIPVVRRQKDKFRWLAEKLDVRRINRSEIITVSIALPDPDDAIKIVNSVTTVFFEDYDRQREEFTIKLLTQLNLELNRQRTMARLLQDEIRTYEKQSANQNKIEVVPTEPILREIALQQSKLASLYAEFEGLLNFNPSDLGIPAEAIRAAAESDPLVRTLEQKKVDLKEQIANLTKDSIQENDPKIIAFQNQIKEIEQKIEEEKGNTEKIKKTLLHEYEYVRNLGIKIVEIQNAVQSQTILVKNLQQKYEGYLAEISSQTTPLLVDTQFQQDQLRRINAIIEQLELRVLTLQSNRYAPPQIELKRKAQAHITTRCGLF